MKKYNIPANEWTEVWWAVSIGVTYTVKVEITPEMGACSWKVYKTGVEWDSGTFKGSTETFVTRWFYTTIWIKSQNQGICTVYMNEGY